MDTGKGHFNELTHDEYDEMVEALKANPDGPPRPEKIFVAGETLWIRNAKFKVDSIGNRFMRLKLQKDTGGPASGESVFKEKIQGQFQRP